VARTGDRNQAQNQPQVEIGEADLEDDRLCQTLDADFSEEKEDDFQPLLISIGIGILTGTLVVLLNTIVHAIEGVLSNSEVTFGILPQVGPIIWGPILGGLFVSATLAIIGGPRGMEGTALPAIRALAAADGGTATVLVAAATDGSEQPLSAAERARRALLRVGLTAATLGSGNSLGPEGPCVEIGANMAALLGQFGDPGKVPVTSSTRKLNLLAAGCAAGLAAGFNAPIAGLFLAVEVVRPPQKLMEVDASLVSPWFFAVAFAAAVVQIGLGSSPNIQGMAFADRTSPFWYFQIPLFIILGVMCGVSSSLYASARKSAGSFFEQLALAGIPRWLYPLLASFMVALVAGSFGLPELLYQGFDNVNGILKQASTAAPSHLLALIFGKMLLTALCSSSGLVGGTFAPAIFIGVCTGALYGQGVASLAAPLGFPVAAASDYATVGVAASLAGICGAPLTAVVLVLELTAGTDYAICLPVILAVGAALYVEKAILRQDKGSRLRDLSKDALTRVAMVTKSEGSDEAWRVFNALDEDNNGSVSREEFRTWLRSVFSRAREISKSEDGDRDK